MSRLARNPDCRRGAVSAPNDHTRRILLETLEPRQLFSGAPYVPDFDGLMVIAAEHYDLITGGDQHEWGLISDASLHDGTAMQAGPNLGAQYEANKADESPRLDYQVFLPEAGTYYVWVRGKADAGSDNSVHVGLDGIPMPEADKIEWNAGNWVWQNYTRDGTRAVMEVTGPGIHTLNVWMREDGVQVDQLALTTEADYSPANMTLDESDRQGGIGGRVWADLQRNSGHSYDDAGIPDVTIYLDENNNRVLDWIDANSNHQWDDGEGERWTLSSVNDPLTPEDESGRFTFDILPLPGTVVRQIVPDGMIQIYPGTALLSRVEPEFFIAPLANGSGKLGSSVAVDGGVVIAGAPESNAVQYASGSITLLSHDADGSWDRVELNEGWPSYAYAGSDVAVSDGVAVIGVTGRKYNSYISSRVEVYRQQPGDPGVWEKTDAIIRPGVQTALFGSAVAIKGDTIAVSEAATLSSNSTYIYEYNGSTWKKTAELAGRAGDNIALDGDTLVIGNKQQQTVWVYVRVNGVWAEQKRIDAPADLAGGVFAADVDLDNGILVVGSPGSDGDGAAYVYHRAGDDWVQRGRLQYGSDYSSQFGASVAVDDGWIVVGDPAYSSGHIQLYAWDGMQWVWRNSVSPYYGSNLQFGADVDIEGDTIVVGAPGVGIHDAESGASIFYNAGEVSVWRGWQTSGVTIYNTRTIIAFQNARPTPPPPDLNASSDTGASDADNLTMRNNASPESILSFTVYDVAPGDTVSLYAAAEGEDPVLIGEALASSASAVVSTDGSAVFADGTYQITAQVTDALGTWLPSDPLSITIDTTPPTFSIDKVITTDEGPTNWFTGTAHGDLATIEVSDDGVSFQRAHLYARDGYWDWSSVSILEEHEIGAHGVYVRATSRSGASQTVYQADTITVHPMPHISISDALVSEGDTGQTQVTLTLSSDRPIVLPIGVQLDITPYKTVDHSGVSNTPTEGIDFIVDTQGLIEWTAEMGLSIDITLTVNGDTEFEANEVISVEVSQDPNLNPDLWSIADGTAYVVIVNDDARPDDAKISGIVWIDRDGNGIRNSDDMGQADVTVYLDEDDDGTLDWKDLNGDGLWSQGEGDRWTVTDLSGFYVFTDLPRGSYVIRQILPDNTVQLDPVNYYRTPYTTYNISPQTPNSYGERATIGNTASAPSTTQILAQAFTANRTGVVDYIATYLSPFGPNTSAPLTISIVEFNNDKPGEVVGSISVPAEELAGSWLKQIDISAEVITVQKGRDYAVVFEVESISGSDNQYSTYINLTTAAASLGWPAIISTDGGATWSEVSAYKELWLQVRLKEGPVDPAPISIELDHGVWLVENNFQNQLMYTVAGDTDSDGDVDDFDLINAITHYTGSLSPGIGSNTAAEGDTDGDGDTDDFDLINLITSYTGSLAAPAPAAIAGNAPVESVNPDPALPLYLLGPTPRQRAWTPSALTLRLNNASQGLLEQPSLFSSDVPLLLDDEAFQDDFSGHPSGRLESEV